MIKRFLSYVEIKTKITSVFAFLLTFGYLLYRGQPIDCLRTGVFFFSMFLFDLTTTAINNFIDTKTNDQVLQFQRRIALAIIFALFAISTALGLYLAYLTDIVVLLLGGICFLTGVFYTYGTCAHIEDAAGRTDVRPVLRAVHTFCCSTSICRKGRSYS